MWKVLTVLAEHIEAAEEVVDAMATVVGSTKVKKKKSNSSERYHLNKMISSFTTGGWPSAYAKEVR
jgi:hypothetical protein